jgi:bifunctional non-homologous end joining protein LigD
VSRRLVANGLAAFRQASRRGLEGIVAKDASAPYAGTRSTRWLKVKVHQQDEFVVGGYTAPMGQRRHLGALLLGARDAGGALRYVGKVGTGFDTRRLAALHALFQPLRRRTPPFADPPPARGVTWLRPRVVAQVAYQERTDGGMLRQAVFLGLRDDKPAGEVLLPEAQAAAAPPPTRRKARRRKGARP